MSALFFSAVSVAAVVIAVAGVVVLALGVRALLRARRSQGWTGLPGTVEASAVAEAPAAAAAPDGTRPTLYRAAIRYRYRDPAGAERTGERVHLDELATSAPGPARELVARYPPGARVTVFVDPADPAQAVLEPGVSRGSTVMPLVGAGLVGLGAAMGAIVRWWSGV